MGGEPAGEGGRVWGGSADTAGGWRGTAARASAWGLDCEAFYRVVGRQRRELWRNGIYLPDGVQLDERCCFGDASAATKCARISNFLVYQVRRRLRDFDAAHPCVDEEWAQWMRERAEHAAEAAGQRGVDVSNIAGDFVSLFTFSMYIDDGMGGSADDLLYGLDGEPLVHDGVHVRRAQRHFEIACECMAEYGWRSKASKEQPPSMVVEALGVQLSLVDGRLRLSAAKRARYAAQARLIAHGRTCARDDYEQMLGRLQFAAQCYPLGRQYTHAAWRVARAAFRLEGGRVSVTRAVHAELIWWAAEMEREGHEGVPMARHWMTDAGTAAAGVLYTDASGEGGFAAWTLGEGVCVMVAGEWTAAERSMPICELELLASTFGFVALAPWLPLDVYTYTDNTVAQAAMRMRRLTAHAAPMQAIVRRRTAWLHAAGRLEAPRRITSKANVWADVGSRPELGGPAAVARMAEAAGLGFVRVAVPADWRDTAALRLCLTPCGELWEDVWRLMARVGTCLAQGWAAGLSTCGAL